MAKQVQPTSLILLVLIVLFVAAKWAYEKGISGGTS
jgi:hypothetical protein